jgi:hypothetical protein
VRLRSGNFHLNSSIEFTTCTSKGAFIDGTEVPSGTAKGGDNARRYRMRSPIDWIQGFRD